MSELPRKQVLECLLAADRLVLTTHMRPDGDALGSQIALARFLQKLGKQVWMINADPAPRTLDWMLDIAEPKTFTGALKQLKAIAEADAVVVLDTGTQDRLGDVGKTIRDAPGLKLVIDHHPDPEGWFDVSLVDTSASAVGELVYELIAEHDAGLVDSEIATALYVAIMTDTGSFRYNATTARTHRIVAELLERGTLSPEPVHIAIFDSRQMSGIRLLSRALDTVTPVYDGQLAYVVVTLAMMDGAGARSEEAEGIVSYPLSLEGVRAAVLFLETPSAIKCSFRSKGDVAVNRWARRFGGGGHRNASGAYIKDRPLKEVIDDVIGVAPNYLDLGQEYEQRDELSADDLALLASFRGKIK